MGYYDIAPLEMKRICERESEALSPPAKYDQKSFEGCFFI